MIGWLLQLALDEVQACDERRPSVTHAVTVTRPREPSDRCLVSFGTVRGGDELSAGSLGCGNDLVEALIPAQIIPARIQAEIAVCRASGDRRDNFELIEGAVALAGPRVNQRQVGNVDRTEVRVLGNRQKIDRLPCLADRFVFSAKTSISFRNARKVRCIL